MAEEAVPHRQQHQRRRGGYFSFAATWEWPERA
jgi:hypothetical protein